MVSSVFYHQTDRHTFYLTYTTKYEIIKKWFPNTMYMIPYNSNKKRNTSIVNMFTILYYRHPLWVARVMWTTWKRVSRTWIPPEWCSTGQLTKAWGRDSHRNKWMVRKPQSGLIFLWKVKNEKVLWIVELVEVRKSCKSFKLSSCFVTISIIGM